MTIRSSVMCVLAAGAILAMCGCGSRSSSGMYRKVRANPTPELETLSLRDVDEDNQQSLAIDENWRMYNEDWNRFWLLDRPSRLARPRVPR